MAKKDTYQINNLKVLWSINRRMWLVKAPSGVVLEEFRLLDKAKAWAKKTKDYLRR